MQTDIIPLKLLKEYSQAFPMAWRQIANMRADRGKALSFWPEWCYCPMAGAIAIITEGAPYMGPVEIEKMKKHPPAVLSALAAWRATKGIYRFDPDLLQEVLKMPLEGNLPVEIFYQLPEWCIYVDAQFPAHAGGESDTILGFFAYLEYDAGTNRHELRFIVFSEKMHLPDMEFFPACIHLGKWTLEEGVRRTFEESERQAQVFGLNPPPRTEWESELGKMVEYITPFVNMVLYICSVNADFGDTGRPQHPANIPRRKGKFPTAQQPRIWDIGVRIGPALKRALKPTENPSAGRENPRTPPRPHYRRAHWHNFWTGPRNQPDERKLILKWLPPIPVGIQDFDDDSENPRPAVIHPIRAE